MLLPYYKVAIMTNKKPPERNYNVTLVDADNTVATTIEGAAKFFGVKNMPRTVEAELEYTDGVLLVRLFHKTKKGMVYLSIQK